MKRYIKIIIVIVIIIAIIAAALLLYNFFKKKAYPLLQYEYESRDSFYEVFEEVDDTEIVDNGLFIVTAEDIEITNGGRDEYNAYLTIKVENVSGEEMWFDINCMEINGLMHHVVRENGWEDQLCDHFDSGQSREYEIWLGCYEEKIEIDRLSLEIEFFQWESEWAYYWSQETKRISSTKEYVRIYPNSKKAFKFEPPQIHESRIYDTLYDKKDVLLTINDGEYEPLSYFLYNGSKNIIDTEVEIEEINGLSNYVEVEDTTSFFYEEEEKSYVLPGAYIREEISSNIDWWEVDDVGYDSNYCCDIRYSITGGKIDVSKTAQIYPQGKDAYNKHHYEYDENDVVIYEDPKYKVSAISASQRSSGDGYYIDICYYIENKTNSKIRLAIPCIQITDSFIYDEFDFDVYKSETEVDEILTLSNKNLVISDSVYVSTLDSTTCYVALYIGDAAEGEGNYSVQVALPFELPFEQTA